MANIFKKIKSIEEVDDVDTDATSRDKADENYKPLGLKPILAKIKTDDLSTSDYEALIVADDDSDLQIPEVDPIDTSEPKTDEPKSTASDQVEAPSQSVSKSSSKSTETQSSTDNNSLNIHPVDIEALPIESTEATLHDNTDNAPSAPTKPDVLSAPDRLPTILSDRPVTPLQVPTFNAPKWPYWTLTLIGFLWLISSAAAAYGYFELGLNSLSANPIHALGFVGFILVPACLLLVTALMLRRMNQLSYESKKMAFINEQLLTPSDYSAKAAANLSKSITGQMDKIEHRAEQAIHRIQQLQSALDQKISSVTDTLAQNAEQHTALDTQLISSKTAWTQTVKDTDQTISELSQSLDTVLQSFQTRIETSQQQFDLVKSSMAEYNQNVETALSEQDNKVQSLSERHNTIKQSSDELRDKWQNDDDLFQERIFNQLSQIDALSEQADALVKKLERSTQKLETHAAEPPVQNLPLRGSMQDEQLNLIPGLGEAKAMLPTLLEAETNLPLDLDFEDIETLDMEEVLYTAPSTPRESLSSQRIGIEPQTSQKKKWFKPFGKRRDQTSPRPDLAQADDLSIPPEDLPTKQATQLPPQNNSYVPLTLSERLIREQLSPDVLIDSGCSREAARLRLHEGPFAMSRYVATHLGAAVVHLRDLLPNNPALHAQVNDMATVFPIREQLDIRDEEALTYIFSSKAGREYLLCEAAVNGSF